MVDSRPIPSSIVLKQTYIVSICTQAQETNDKIQAINNEETVHRTICHLDLCLFYILTIKCHTHHTNMLGVGGMLFKPLDVLEAL